MRDYIPRREIKEILFTADGIGDKPMETTCGINCGCNTQNVDLVSIAKGDKHHVTFDDGASRLNLTKTDAEIIADLRQQVEELTKQVIYSCSPDRDVHFVQGDKAFELCDLVTAENVQRLFDYANRSQFMDNVWLTRDEALILQKLVKGFIVGPAGRAVLDKLNAVK